MSNTINVVSAVVGGLFIVAAFLIYFYRFYNREKFKKKAGLYKCRVLACEERALSGKQSYCGFHKRLKLLLLKHKKGERLWTKGNLYMNMNACFWLSENAKTKALLEFEKPVAVVKKKLQNVVKGAVRGKHNHHDTQKHQNPPENR